MAAAPSLSLSNLFSIRPPAESQSLSQKNHLSFPVSLPSLSLQTPKAGNRLIITLMGTYNVQVVVDENESEDRLLNRFRREVMRAGVIRECKRRMFFENKRDGKKRKAREAAKRNRKRRPQSKAPYQDKETTTKKEKYDSEDDNWDLPEGDLPY
ncbi:hypothetical protein Nepgr_003032 [Nepenthes gracilis]|uniref:30S ribosomal protein S21, chloroplastic n=1 Tax=Nepenthes gracilis TaxID=150966 RepID=A0AAD3RYS2_NEPGR|nr:hypothetical protein Nepgr_003032 [Nepenthes gracilis]